MIADESMDSAGASPPVSDAVAQFDSNTLKRMLQTLPEFNLKRTTTGVVATELLGGNVSSSKKAAAIVDLGPPPAPIDETQCDSSGHCIRQMPSSGGQLSGGQLSGGQLTGGQPFGGQLALHESRFQNTSTMPNRSTPAFESYLHQVAPSNKDPKMNLNDNRDFDTTDGRSLVGTEPARKKTDVQSGFLSGSQHSFPDQSKVPIFSDPVLSETKSSTHPDITTPPSTTSVTTTCLSTEKSSSAQASSAVYASTQQQQQQLIFEGGSSTLPQDSVYAIRREAPGQHLPVSDVRVFRILWIYLLYIFFFFK